MKIIISGYGRMGKKVEKLALQHGHQIVAVIDQTNDWKNITSKMAADVVIDFSLPEVVIDNINRCFEMGIPIVTGTTGWYQKMDEIAEVCHNNNGTLFYAPNFSIGVNLFFLVNKKLAATMSAFDDYEVSMKEIHHIHKLDAPSGTAIKAAEDLIQEHIKLSEWKLMTNRKEGVLPIDSVREGEVPGTHTVKYSSDADMIELKHEAKNRSGFAKGALMAAEWVVSKKGIYSMDDLLKSIL